MSSCSRRRADGRAPRLAALLLLAAGALRTVWAVAAVASVGQLAVAAVVPSTVDHQVSLVASVSPVPATVPRPGDFAVAVGEAPVPSTARPVLSDRLALALVVDGSAAGRPALQATVNGATDLLLQLPASARSAAVVDTGPPAVPAPLSRGPTSAVGALSAVRSGGERRTAQALALAVEQLPRDATTPRVVVLTTGAADAGGEPADELGRRLREARVLLAVVGTGPDQAYWAAAAGETGGLLVDARRTTPLAAFGAVAAGLRGRYLVTFPLPGRLPTRVTVRLDTAGGPLSAGAAVPAAAPVDAPAAPADPPAGGRGGPGGGLVLVLVLALAAGAGALVRALRRRGRPRPSVPAPPAAPVAPAAAPHPPRVTPLLRDSTPTPAPDPDPGPAGEADSPTEADSPEADSPEADSPEADSPAEANSPAEAEPGLAGSPDGAARRAGPEPTDTNANANANANADTDTDTDTDENAYRQLDAEVGLAAAAVEDGHLDARRAVARIALAAPGRPDLLDRVADTERRMAGARLAASPATSTVLDLLAAARRVLTGETTLVGPDGARVEQAGRRLRLTRDGEPDRDIDSVGELARHVDLAALAEESPG